MKITRSLPVAIPDCRVRSECPHLAATTPSTQQWLGATKSFLELSSAPPAPRQAQDPKSF